MMINCSNNMDEGVGEAVTSMDAIDGTHLQSKESEYSLKPSSSNMLDSHEMVIPGENDDHDNENSPPLVSGLLGGRNLDRIGSAEHASVSPCCMDGAGVTVEELTVREFNGENLAIVGPSDNREGLQTKQNRWQHLYQIAGGSGTWSTPGGGAFKDNDKDIVSSAWEDGGYAIFPENMGLKRANEKGTDMFSNKIRPISNSIPSPEGIRTKILSKSGFSEYFVKNTLKGKGVIYKGPVPGRSNADLRSQTHAMATGVSTDAEAPLSSSVSAAIPHSDMMDASGPDDSCGEHSLRRWLKSGQNMVDKVESLRIFRQIVDLVDFSHSQGVPLQNLWPSCFKLLRSNQIMHLGSSVLKEKSDSNRDQVINASVDHLNERRQLEHDLLRVVSPEAKKQKIGEKMNYFRWGPQFPIRSGIKLAAANHTADSISGPQGSRRDFNRENNLEIPNKFQSMCSRPNLSITSHTFMTSVYDPLEENWYRSPEELNGRCCTFASNIYCLGVLLFELLGSFDSERAHAVAMSDLRYRILPANFLSENPKEAGFCLWLLHPEPSSRPTTREILQSEILSGLQDLCGDELSSSIDQEEGDSEVLLHFLESLKDQKQKDASKLVEQIGFLGADIQEVDKRRTKNSLVLASLHDEFLNAKISEFLHGEHSGSEAKYKTISQSNNGLRLMRCINQLESAYFSMRSNIQVSDNFVTRGTDNELLKNREKWYSSRVVGEKPNTDGLGAFFDGLCKYARYSQFEVQGVIRNGDFNNSANVICSLSFDRDEDYFAAAGVSKKIRIYEFDALFNHSVDIHYPLIEMSNKSKLSCVCWNNYIRNYLASTDYDGVVKLWDAGTGQVVSHFIEHNKRAWSVDFSQVDPTKLASGSDDCSVKLWSINEKSSLCTIRNIANVCCVQFSPQSSNLLAFGSADYKTYCYDLRNVSIPWCILAGRDKAVSYVKFLDSETVVSASTDNTLKLWDLNKTSSNGLSTNACILSLRGHSNEKNFVGLSVSNGYIACGSETNEVFAYYRSLPMPITSHKFGSIDPVTGKETNDDNGQFVSSVCWRKKSDMVVAANSNGCIKLLQMV